mmetsp:Transcript_14354/g.33038  ORF Transcript_14354/g.33038 Transcript_14354/m.33038 type:complete len:228 (-) Transcript_14354:15-698(-)
MPWDQSAMNGSSLDPYTRTLAYVADVVTRARASLPTSPSGRMAMVAVLLFIGSLVLLIALLTSFLWAPFSMFGFSIYIGVFTFRVISKRSSQLLHHVKHHVSRSYHLLVHQAGRLKAYALEPWKRQERQAAIRDRGFLRNIFEALPEVDADGALQRMEHWMQNVSRDGDPFDSYCSFLPHSQPPGLVPLRDKASERPPQPSRKHATSSEERNTVFLSEGARASENVE